MKLLCNLQGIKVDITNFFLIYLNLKMIGILWLNHPIHNFARAVLFINLLCYVAILSVAHAFLVFSVLTIHRQRNIHHLVLFVDHITEHLLLIYNIILFVTILYYLQTYKHFQLPKTQQGVATPAVDQPRVISFFTIMIRCLGCSCCWFWFMVAVVNNTTVFILQKFLSFTADCQLSMFQFGFNANHRYASRLAEM